MKTLYSMKMLLLVASLLLANFSLAENIDLQKLVDEVHQKYLNVQEGKNADYIPALAKVNDKLFSVSIVTAEGKMYNSGDVKHHFSVQSIGKIFTLALAMDQQGSEAIMDKIGVDATGLPFNSVMAVELNKERSVNPLVNAGAMAAVSMVKAKNKKAKWNMIEQKMEVFAGRDLTVLDEIYKSEAATNQHNQAIAKLLESYERFYDDVAESVDLYTRMCSVGVTSRDLAVMGATYANGGVNPITGKRAVKAENVPRILSVMATAGLYDDTGIWLYKVGLPAKSGVGGGIVAIVPGKYGIAAFAPPLDAAGNSVRAQLAIEEIAERLNASIFK